MQPLIGDLWWIVTLFYQLYSVPQGKVLTGNHSNMNFLSTKPEVSTEKISDRGLGAADRAECNTPDNNKVNTSYTSRKSQICHDYSKKKVHLLLTH